VLELDGKSAYRFRLPGDWRLPSAFTIECWARGGHPDGEQALVSQCQLSGAGLWWFTNTDHPGRAPARAPGGIVFDARRKGGADYARANSGALEVGVWHHLAMTYENGRVRFFVNGTLESEATVNQPRMNQRYVFIGADPSARDTPEFNFTGLIDDVRISRGARYAKSFKPATHLAFDETTISLVDFQRAAVGPGGGDTTHAIVQGKTWARATPYGSPRIVPHDR
jgi:hypothetical protein